MGPGIFALEEEDEEEEDKGKRRRGGKRKLTLGPLCLWAKFGMGMDPCAKCCAFSCMEDDEEKE